MRIIAGKYGGMHIKQPMFDPTRPTTNIAKEALFNMLENYYNFDNIRFLDLFAGTGQISLEFASRGCTDITSVDLHHKCTNFIQETAEKLQIDGIKVMPMDVFDFMNKTTEQFDIIFAGPPYPLPTLPNIPDIVFENKLILDKGWFIMEHNPNHNFKNHPNFYKKRNYGQTIFSIFVNAEAYNL